MFVAAAFAFGSVAAGADTAWIAIGCAQIAIGCAFLASGMDR